MCRSIPALSVPRLRWFPARATTRLVIAGKGISQEILSRGFPSEQVRRFFQLYFLRVMLMTSFFDKGIQNVPVGVGEL
jgi:hypothetical protein